MAGGWHISIPDLQAPLISPPDAKSGGQCKMYPVQEIVGLFVVTILWLWFMLG